MSNLPVETLEARYPILIEEYGLRDDSGGAGQFRGGLGLVRQYRLLADEAVLQLRADRHEHPPYGLFGGLPGAPSRNFIEVDGERSPAGQGDAGDHQPARVIRHEQAGGGGYGDPYLRSLPSIRADLADGKVGRASAEQLHGVVFKDGEIDEPATALRRQRRGTSHDS